jgi:hypothetical protein
MTGTEGAGDHGQDKPDLVYESIRKIAGGSASPLSAGLTERGQRDRVLRYSSKSAEDMARALRSQGLDVYPSLVAGILKENGFTLRTLKNTGGLTPEDAERRLKYLEKMARAYIKRDEPVALIEGKAFNRRTGRPKLAYDPEYLAEELERDSFSGGYHLFRRAGFSNAGLTGISARTAVGWLEKLYGTAYFDRYRDKDRMLLVADFCGGEEWVLNLQETASRTRKRIRVLRLPPGITRWSHIEHRFYLFIGGDGTRPFHRVIIITMLGSGEDTGISVEGVRGWDSWGNGDGPDFRREWEYSILPRKQRGRGRS